MKRAEPAFFEWNGTLSTHMGILLLDAPVRTQPARTGGSYATIAGRDGQLWVGGSAYGNASLRLSCAMLDPTRFSAAMAWLNGSGVLRLYDEPDFVVDAEIVKAFDRSALARRLQGQKFTITFSCQPLKRLRIPAEPITIAQSGQSFENPGTAPAQPIVRIAGHGDFSVTIDDQTVFFSGVDGGGITVDTPRMDAFTFDGLLLANDKMSGAPFAMKPGTTNTVSWLADAGSSVESIVITPNWRYL